MDLLSDNELFEKIENNNKAMQKIINEDPFNVNGNNDSLKKLYEINLEYYKEAFKREIKAPNINFMMAIATALGQQIDDLFFKKKNLTKRR